MSQKRVIILNTLSNVGMQAVAVGLPFLLLPYMLRYWGKETYGILVLAYSVQAFVFFLNSAIHLTLMKYVAEVHELRDEARLNTIINVFWVVAFLNNLAVSVVLAAVGLFGLEWLNVPPELTHTARSVLLIMAGCGVVAGCFSFVDGVMYGLQKIHLSNLFGTIEAVMVAATALATIVFGASLPVYVLAISTFPIVSRALQFAYIKRAIPGFRLRIAAYFDFGELKRLSRFSGYQIINQVSDLLIYNAQKLIIQKVMGPASLTMYEIANKPNLLFQNFVSLPLAAILPACSAAYARGDHDFLEKMLIMGTRIYLVMVLPPLFAFILLMDPFLPLWLGPDYLPAVPAAQLLLCALLIGCPFKVFAHMMVGKGRVFEYGLTKFVYAVVAVPVSVYAISHYGIIGGVAVSFSYWVVAYVPTHLYVMRREGISSLRVLRSMFPVIAMLAVEYVLVEVARSFMPGHTWIEFAALLGFSVLATMLATFFLVLRTEERALLGVRF